jgi:hypothetical protein
MSVASPLWHTNCALEIESNYVVDFRVDVVLDPVREDYLTRKLLLTLRGIGRPASAGEDANAARALGLVSAVGTNETTVTPEALASEFL